MMFRASADKGRTKKNTEEVAGDGAKGKGGRARTDQIKWFVGHTSQVAQDRGGTAVHTLSLRSVPYHV